MVKNKGLDNGRFKKLMVCRLQKLEDLGFSNNFEQ